MIRFIAHILGLDSPDDPWYLFWSGVGTFTAFWSYIWTHARRNNCTEPWCLRFGRWRIGEGRVCSKHREAARRRLNRD